MQVRLLYRCQATLITIAILVTRPIAVQPIRVVGRPQPLNSNADRLAVWVVDSMAMRDQLDRLGRRLRHIYNAGALCVRSWLCRCGTSSSR